MSNNPYENEPGFENARSASDEKNQSSYREKVSAFHSTFTPILSNSF
jgi:hypothetical protein